MAELSSQVKMLYRDYANSAASWKVERSNAGKQVSIRSWDGKHPANNIPVVGFTSGQPLLQPQCRIFTQLSSCGLIRVCGDLASKDVWLVLRDCLCS